MSGHSQIVAAEDTAPHSVVSRWFAIQTRSRHEKKVAEELQRRGVTTFLPTLSRVQRWSDRLKTVEFPLFSCYAFVQIVPTTQSRLAVLTVNGVLCFVGPTHQGTPIPANQIEDLRTLVLNRVAMQPHSFLNVGQRVRIRGGALNGVEGIVSGFKGNRQLVVSIETIQRSISVSIEGYDVEPV